MKTLAVTGVTVGLLEGTHALRVVSQVTPFVKNYPVAGRVAVDVIAIVAGVFVSSKQNYPWIAKGIGAGIAIEGFVDGLKVLVPSFGGN